MPDLPRLYAAALVVAIPLVAGRRADAQTTRDSARIESTTVPVFPLWRVPARGWGAAVGVMDSAAIVESTAPTFSELLQARLPGVRVLRSGGMASDGSLVMLRGPVTLLGPNEPIVVVDGVRLSPIQRAASMTGTVPRLDDVLPEDVERIEVLNGSAAALYGDGGANGVIVITTRSGDAGPLRLHGRVDTRTSFAEEPFPLNYLRVGVSPTTGQPATDCTLVAVAENRCTPTGLEVWNPFAPSPFRTAQSTSGHLALDGSTFGTGLFLSGSGRQTGGVQAHDDNWLIGWRARLTRELPGHLRLEAGAGYVADNARVGGDNTGGTADLITNRLFQRAPDELLPQGDSTYPVRRRRHHTDQVIATWEPWSWLSASAMTGRDYAKEHQVFDVIDPSPSPFSIFYRMDDETDARNAALRVAARYPVGLRVMGSTAIGLERQTLRSVIIDSVTDLSSNLNALSESFFTARSTSLVLSQSAELPRRLTVNASLARITSILSGSGEWFPGVNAAWFPFTGPGLASTMRLRLAYAEAAGSTESVRPFVFNPGPFSGSVPPKPRMERTAQSEIGVDGVIGGTMTGSLTVFRSRSRNLFVPTLAPSGFEQLALQGGEIHNNGIELSVRAPLLATTKVRWDMALALSTLNNRVTKTPAPRVGFTGSIAQGYAYGTAYAFGYTFADANHDGIIDTSEVQLAPSATFIGPPLPKLEAALSSNLALPGRVVVSATVDYRQHYYMLNTGEDDRCAHLQNCRAAQDSSASLSEQAAVVAHRKTEGFPVVAFVDDASFAKLREVALHWRPPASWRIVGQAAEVTLAGRNLATWTKVRGYDPEVSSGAPSELPRQGYRSTPVPRELLLRLDVGAP